MNKIKLVSRFFRVLFQITFVAVPICLILYWLNAPYPLLILGNTMAIDLIPHTMPNFPLILHLSNQTKFLGFLVSLIPASLILIVCYFLIKLFRLYERNEIFSLNNIFYLRKVAAVVIASELVFLPIYQGLLSLVLTWHYPTHFVVISVNFSILLLSLLLLLISWIMAEGFKLQDEQQFTI
ncbi:MAG: DUF2975 domain-containing protein [Pseudomonadota bacterium]